MPHDASCLAHRSATVRLSLALLVAVSLAGCSTAPKTPGARDDLRQAVNEARAAFLEADPSMRTLFDNEYAYALFPSVGKGAAGIGGAFGRGEVYRNGRMVGYCSLSQGTIGLQLGGQAYSEVIFFKNAAAFDAFKSGDFALAAQASAVAATAGASADADYESGVLVFTMAKGGLMYEASVGGQKFSYEDK